MALRAIYTFTDWVVQARMVYGILYRIYGLDKTRIVLIQQTVLFTNKFETSKV